MDGSQAEDANEEKMSSEMKDLLDEYEDIFRDDLPRGMPVKRNVEHEINIKENSQPPKPYLYRLSYDEPDILKENIEALLKKEHIMQSNSPYASPVLFAKKPGKASRFCIDYGAL